MIIFEFNVIDLIFTKLNIFVIQIFFQFIIFFRLFYFKKSFLNKKKSSNLNQKNSGIIVEM